MSKKGVQRRGWGGKQGRVSQPKPERLICETCRHEVNEISLGQYTHTSRAVAHDPVPTYAD